MSEEKVVKVSKVSPETVSYGSIFGVLNVKAQKASLKYLTTIMRKRILEVEKAKFKEKMKKI